jgi:hypothetical protein
LDRLVSGLSLLTCPANAQTWGAGKAREFSYG